MRGLLARGLAAAQPVRAARSAVVVLLLLIIIIMIIIMIIMIIEKTTHVIIWPSAGRLPEGATPEELEDLNITRARCICGSM